MWAILAVLSAVGASILGTWQVAEHKRSGKKHRRAKVVFHSVSGPHSVQAQFTRNKESS